MRDWHGDMGKAHMRKYNVESSVLAGNIPIEA